MEGPALSGPEGATRPAPPSPARAGVIHPRGVGINAQVLRVASHQGDRCRRLSESFLIKMKKTILQIAAMACVGFLTGLAVNAVSPEPLPLLAPPEQFELEVDPEKAVTSSEIVEIWESGEAIFIDARSEDMYAKGRIPTAFSLPYDDFEEGMAELDPFLPRDQLVVIYCDGADCHSSEIVYEKFLQYGFEKEFLKIFNGGWNDWLKLGGEVDSDNEEE